MEWLTGWLLGLHGLPLYALVGLIVFAEDALFVGFVFPGEIAAILGGVAASAGHANLAVMITVVVVAAIVGDTVGYEVGRHLGPRLLSARALGRHRRRVDSARDLMARRGGTAVFLGRFVAFFRATMPALAGASRMPYPRFLAYNAAGGVTWGVAAVLVGELAGSSYAVVEKTFGRVTALVVLAAVLMVIAVWRVRRHRRHRGDGETEVDRPSAPEGG
ncbi:DedA family protein [Actinopolymorpha pittospori]|uniref:Membrane protein DedA with SNARE-associated domain n=1 Tax=Actinopolymorpha pittospori TaxID=648752 RepID=A0A927N1C5_9ACTN|nr:DedA family protein [Actinopolymorpha pittospori]MBE1609128.1 membrane protein DedA with SNARE-associated domain [Actinopolymorpha pittospori]